MLVFDRTPAGRNRLFWTVNTVGWLGYYLFMELNSDLKGKPIPFPVNELMFLTGYLITICYRFVYLRLWNRSPAVLLAGALLTWYLGAVAWHQFIDWSFIRFLHRDFHGHRTTAGFFTESVWIGLDLLTWSALYFGIKYYDSLRVQRERTLRAEALAQEAQVKMLRYQLNPHFLFNTLNAISTLILSGQNRSANQAVTRLSQFLRYTLDQDPMKKVTLRQEVEALDLYLSTERLRFGDRLALEFAIEDEALDALMPSLLLQPLIENAVKYAVAPREDGGSIRIEGRARAGMLELSVQDDGPGLANAGELGNGRGVGLRNTRERLAVVYGERHRFAALNSRPGLRIEVAMPLEKDGAA
jgi:signal transduction histidine kinase